MRELPVRISPFPFLVYSMGFHDKTWRTQVLNFKLHQAIQPIWTSLRAWKPLFDELFNSSSVIIPVPNSPLQVFHYGFYPTLALSEMMQKLLQKPLLPRALRMNKGLGQIKWLRQNTHKFATVASWLQPGPQASALPGESVLLIDDVLNTGTTLQATAEHLLKRQAKQVTALTLSYSFLGNYHACPCVPWNADLQNHWQREKRPLEI
jgi:predicted amidophosphoribosyltransferase